MVELNQVRSHLLLHNHTLAAPCLKYLVGLLCKDKGPGDLTAVKLFDIELKRRGKEKRAIRAWKYRPSQRDAESQYKQDLSHIFISLIGSELLVHMKRKQKEHVKNIDSRRPSTNKILLLLKR